MKTLSEQISLDKKTRPIGIFDSGIGGVTVLKEIIKLCENIVKLFIEKNCKAIVIACNTASAKAVKYLRKKYPKIIFIAIEPAYKMVHDYAYNEPTLVMATKGTIEEQSEQVQNLFKYIYSEDGRKIIESVGLIPVDPAS